jgi:hypothetical protein
MKHDFNLFFLDDQKKIIEMKEKIDVSFVKKFSQIIWTLWGIINLYLFIKTGETLKLIMALIGLLWFVIFLLDYNKSFESIISFENITSAEYKNHFFQKSLILKLKNNKKRIIHTEFTKENIQLIENIFKENSIVFLDSTNKCNIWKLRFG